MASLAEAPKVFQRPLEPGGTVSQPWLEINRFDPDRMWRIAEQMLTVSLAVSEGDRLLIDYHPGGIQLASMLAYQAASKGVAVLARCSMRTMETAILAGVAKHPTPKIQDEMAGPESSDVLWATHVAFVRCDDTPDALDIVDPETLAARTKAREAALEIRVNRRRWCGIYIPAVAEAVRDNMDFSAYVAMFLDACDRDWVKIREAQDILISMLDQGKQLELFADEGNPDERWRTHLTMSIEGMTFANSTIDLNFPGSEVFSAPKRDTVNGRLALPYPVMFAGRILPNLILDFKNGRVVDFYIDGDRDLVQQILDKEGAREVGEIAFGGNPAFRRPMLNRLFVEKVAGSFHIALGSAYELREYSGKSVQVDNGVRSAFHIDLTRMLRGDFGGGRVLLDGQLLSQDGVYLDPRLAILNPTPKP